MSIKHAHIPMLSSLPELRLCGAASDRKTGEDKWKNRVNTGKKEGNVGGCYSMPGFREA